jgi:hypothetical protein
MGAGVVVRDPVRASFGPCAGLPSAPGCLARLEENLRLVERGRLDVPPGCRPWTLLISDGKLEKPVELVPAIRLSELFHIYQTEFTAGAKEVITRAMEDIRMKHLSRIIGGETLLAVVTAGTVQTFVDERKPFPARGTTLSLG